MPVSKAQQKAVNKYMAANYDRINLTVPKGKKDTIQAHAEVRGQSVNGFINSAIDEKMERDAAGGSQGAGVVSLPSETLEAAQRAAQASGEAPADFIARAIETQVQRDKSSLRMGLNPVTGDKLEKETGTID